MARGCSDSDSEEERHDRFKSERKPSSAPIFRSNLPSSLDSYSRSRSPLRRSSYSFSKNKSRYSEERRYSSPKREEKSSEWRGRKLSPKENQEKGRSSSSEHKRSKHRHKKSHDKFRSERCDEKTRVRSSDNESRTSEHITTNEDHSDSDSLSHEIGEDSSDCVLKDSKNSNSHDERKVKKHKKSHDQSGSHNGKKRKKDKKHKRKHSKKKNENDKEMVSTVKLCKQMSKVNEKSDKHNEESYHCTLNVSYSGESEIESEKSLPSGRVPLNGETTDIELIKDHEEGELSGSESEQYFGPALPPGKSSKKIYGPQMSSDAASYGPTPPSEPPLSQQSTEDDLSGDVIGPLPAGIESTAQSALDARASILKYHMDNKPDEDTEKKRESWMVELPEVRGAQLGLGPRKFRTNPAPDMSDRSSWTDTPEEKARRQMLGEEEESSETDTKKLEIEERNKEMDKLVKKSEKKSKSLLELHQKELKKKRKKEEKERGIKPKERIPFNRETDLLTNKFDEAQKRSIIKKAQLLNSRFSVGESKYL